MKIVSVRDTPHCARAAIQYFQKQWASEESKMVYEDCILHSLTAQAPLPQWYLLYEEQKIIGGAGLVTNDFISRMDLYPWLCALYIESDYRGHSYGQLLIERVKADAKEHGFSDLYLSTDHVGYYERYGFSYLSLGYHPWGESSRIYQAKL